MADIESSAPRPGPQIPVFPDVYDRPAQAEAEVVDQGISVGLKPQIFAVADNTASAMSEVVDNHSVEIDPFTLTETVSRSRQGEELKKEHALAGGSPIKEFWNGFLDDLLGPKQPTSARK